MPRRPDPDAIRTERIPAEMAEVALGRCRGFLKASTYDANMMESLMLSCYMQGLIDGWQVTAQRPELQAQLEALYNPPPEDPGYGHGV